MKSPFSQIYLRRAQIIAEFLRFAPFVRMVLLNGSVAKGEATDKSDIDFLIVAKADRIFSGRFFATLLVHLTGFRRYDDKIAGRICLNRYQTTDNLTLNPRTQKNALYHASTICLWQKGDLYQRFKQSNNWFKKYQVDFQHQKPRSDNYFWQTVSTLIQWVLEFIFELALNDWGEKICKQYQTTRINHDIRTIKANPGEIFVSDNELRFHPRKNLTKI